MFITAIYNLYAFGGCSHKCLSLTYNCGHPTILSLIGINCVGLHFVKLHFPVAELRNIFDLKGKTTIIPILITNSKWLTGKVLQTVVRFSNNVVVLFLTTVLK